MNTAVIIINREQSLHLLRAYTRNTLWTRYLGFLFQTRTPSWSKMMMVYVVCIRWCVCCLVLVSTPIAPIRTAFVCTDVSLELRCETAQTTTMVPWSLKVHHPSSLMTVFRQSTVQSMIRILTSFLNCTASSIPCYTSVASSLVFLGVSCTSICSIL